MIPRNLAQRLGMSPAERRSDGMAGVLRRGVLLGALLLAACQASPTITPSKVAEVKPKETTYDQVVDMFGLPSAETNLSGGVKVAIYNWPEYDRSLFQMMPFLNLTENNYTNLGYDYFIFNRDGVLESFSIPHYARLADVPNPGN
jgi:hypothetical protein